MKLWMAVTEKKLVWEGFWESALWGALVHSPSPLLNAVHLASHQARKQPYLIHLSSQPVCLFIKKPLQLFHPVVMNTTRYYLTRIFRAKSYPQTLQSNKKTLVYFIWFVFVMFLLWTLCSAKWTTKHFILVYNNRENFIRATHNAHPCK